jgi:hypothetical protein
MASSPELQRVAAEAKAEVIDMAEGNVVAAIRRRDMPTTRWFLERHHPAYARKREIKDMAPPDPQTEAKRAEVMRLVVAMLEERARLGSPRIFAKGPAPKMLEITDHGGKPRASDKRSWGPPER